MEVLPIEVQEIIFNLRNLTLWKSRLESCLIKGQPYTMNPEGKLEEMFFKSKIDTTFEYLIFSPIGKGYELEINETYRYKVGRISRVEYIHLFDANGKSLKTFHSVSKGGRLF